MTAAVATRPEPRVAEATLRAAPTKRARPPRPSPLSASVTFAWRALLKIGWVGLWSAVLLAIFAPLTMRFYASER